MPRRGASSVVDSRSGTPEPESGHGEPPTQREGAAEYSRGPRSGPPCPRPPSATPSTWLVGLLIALGRLRAVRASRTPSTTTSTTTSCGRPMRSSTGAPGSRYPVPAGGRPAGERVLPGRLPAHVPGRDAGRARPASLPAAAGARAAAVRRGVGAGDGPGGDRHRPRRPSAWAWPGGCSAGCGSARRSGAHDAGLRDRDRLVVGGRRGQHLVPRPPRRRGRRAARRGGRAAPAIRRRGAKRPPEGRGRPCGRRRRRPDRRRRAAGSAGGADAGRPCGRWTARRCSPGSCSGSPRPPGCRSSSPRRFSCRGRRRLALSGAWPRPRWAASCRWRCCSATRTLTTGLVPRTRGTTTSTSWRPRAIPRSATTLTGPRRISRYLPQNLGSCWGRCPRWRPDIAAEHPGHHRGRPAVHQRRGRSAPCSTSLARW